MAGFNPGTWPTFQQSMPVAQGAMTGEELLRAHLQNQMQKQQNEARPGMDAANLAKMLQYNQAQPGLDEAKRSQMEAATRGQDISNQQSPELLALKEYMAQVAAKNAEHGRQNINLQYDKLPALYANAAARETNIPLVQSAAGEKGDPTGIAGNILRGAIGFSNKFAQVSGQPSPAGYNQPPDQQQMALQQALSQAQRNRPQEQQMNQPKFPALQQYIQAQSQPQSGQAGAPQQFQQPPQAQQQSGGISPEVLARAQDATRSSQIKKTRTAQQANQMQFAGNLEELGAPIEAKIPLVGRYFGFGGKAALAKDIGMMKKNGTITPELREYRKLTKSLQLYANEFGRSLGDSASYEQQKALEKLVNPDWVYSNPDLALSTFKGLRKNESRIDKSLARSPSQTQEMLARKGSETDQQPQSQPSSMSPPVVSAAPAGTVRMINPDDGKVYRVAKDQVDDAISSHRWSRA